MKIGIAWADLERRFDAAAVLRLCRDGIIPSRSNRVRIMGVDTGRALLVVILQLHSDR